MNQVQRENFVSFSQDYMAPEVIENEDVNNHVSASSVESTAPRSPIPYEESADLWSLGIITYELLVGTTPFYDPDIAVTKKRILSCDYHLPEFLHTESRDLISRLIKYHRHERLTLANVVEHNFIQTFAHKNFMNETFHQLASLHHFKINNNK